MRGLRIPDRHSPNPSIAAHGQCLPPAPAVLEYFPPGTPGWPDGQYFGLTSYGPNTGTRGLRTYPYVQDGVMHINTRVRVADVTDGTTNTILFGEMYHHDPNFDSFPLTWNSNSLIAGWSWWCPVGGDNGLQDVLTGAFAPINYRIPWKHGDAGAPTTNSAWFTFQDMRLGSIGSGHTGGANVVFTDGSVRFLPNSLPQATLQLLCVRNDGQVIPNF